MFSVKTILDLVKIQNFNVRLQKLVLTSHNAKL